MRLAARRPLVVTALVVGSVAASLLAGRAIRVDPDLSALLPHDSPSRRSLETMKARTAQRQPLYLLVASSDAALNRRLAADLAREVSGWRETRWAIARRDPSMFWSRRLLFLPATAIDELATQLGDLVRYEKCQATPGCFTLDDRPEEPDEDTVRRLLDQAPETKALVALLGGDAEAKAAPAEVEEEVVSGAPPSGDLCSADGGLCAVEASLDGDPSNLEFAEEILARVDALFVRLRPASAPGDLRFAVSGPYRNAPVSKQVVSQDLQRASWVTAGLMLALIIGWYRSLRTLVLLAVPLLVGLAWTAAFIAVVDPVLNVLTAFTLGVLGGLGIEYGMHILAHWQGQMMGGQDKSAALAATIDRIGPSMTISVVTTAVGFLSLVAARFRGFSEMGVLASVGVVLTLTAFLVTLPLLAARVGPRARRPRTRAARTGGLPRRPAMLVVVAGGLAAVGLGIAGTRIQFEHDFRKLQPQVVSHGLPWTGAMHGSTRMAVFLLADSADALESVAATLRREGPGRLGDPSKPWVLTPRSFVPADQPARLAAAGRLTAAVDQALGYAEGKPRQRLQRLRDMADVQTPIEARALPPWARDWLFERDGRFGTMGMLYTDLSGADARQMQVLSEHMQTWRRRFPQVVFASASAQIGEVIPGLGADAPLVIALALAGLALSTLLVSRSWRRTSFVLVPLSMATAVGMGVMVLSGIEINLYNLIVFPLFLGISVDGAVYVVWCFEGHDDYMVELGPRVRAIVISTLANMTGFAGMLMARNPGIASLGQAALIMLGAALLVNVVWLPCLLAWLHRPPRGKGADRDNAAQASASSPSSSATRSAALL
jgi:hypothetical protein